MKEFDSQKAARVWQRVQSDQGAAPRMPGGEQLPALIMEQRELAAVYIQLAQKSSGKEAAILQRLSREAQAQATCLKGMCLLLTGQVPENRVSAVQKSTTDAALRRCYGREMHLLKEYENRREDPEYGPVFERLAGRGREHCCILLELIGKLGKK